MFESHLPQALVLHDDDDDNDNDDDCGTKMKDELQDSTTSNNGSSVNEEKNGCTPVIMKWSSELCSPTSELCFSPSMDMQEKNSLHGSGLIAAVDRAKRLCKGGMRCSSFFLQLANSLDAYASLIFKSCNILSSYSSNEYPQMISQLVIEVKECLISFAKQTQGLAICIKGSIARPLYSSSLATEETVPSIYQRYTLSRVKAYNSRQLALKIHNTYLKSISLAKTQFKESSTKQTTTQTDKKFSYSSNDKNRDRLPSSNSINSTDTPTSSSHMDHNGTWTWKQVAQQFRQLPASNQQIDQVVTSLKKIHNLERQYKNYVKEENTAVSRCQTMEKMALEALQELEEERLHFFLETLGRYLLAEKGALDNMSLLLRRYSDDFAFRLVNRTDKESLSPDQILSSSKNHNKNDSNDNNANMISAVEDATSLGLPKAVGQWRDVQKRNIALQKGSHSAAKLIVSFSQQLSSATTDFTKQLASLLSSEGYYDTSRSSAGKDNLKFFMVNYECPRTLNNWNQFIKTLVDCHHSASNLASTLDKNCQSKLGNRVRLGEKQIKNTIDAEEMRWKHICDAAKLEVKTKQKWESTQADLERAKERIASVDTTKNNNNNNKSNSQKTRENQEDNDPSIHLDQNSSTNRTSSSATLTKNNPINKALGNMFSILPNGGEEAMSKMLSPEQRIAVAQTSLKSVKSKEVKDRKSYMDASESKKKAIDAYTGTSEQCYKRQCEEEREFWCLMKEVCAGAIESFQDFQRERFDCNRAALAFVNGENSHAIQTDVFGWTKLQRQRLESLYQEIEEKRRKNAISSINGKNNYDGFQLEANLIDPREVYKFLETAFNNTTDNSSSALKRINFQESSMEVEISSPSPNDIKRTINTDSKQSPPSFLKQSMDEASVGYAETKLDNDSNRTHLNTAPAENEIIRTPVRKISESHKSFVSETQTSVFLTHFWDSKGDESPPTVIDSFSCAYWPKEEEGFFSPLLHGRMFCTSTTMYFVGWGDKKIVLNWEDVISITKETTAYGTVPNALLITYESGEGESSYFFGSFAFRENAAQLLNRLATIARSISEVTKKKTTKKTKRAKVPPDAALKKMEVILSKKIKNMSIQRFYELCWSEGFQTNESPFYGPFLHEDGCFDVVLPDWEVACDDSSGFEHKFSEEKYERRRVVKFKFNRTTHLYVGPPVANVNQTHHCRIEGEDKCVLTMTTDIEGIPYADCFAVEVRWVARRDGSRDIQVDVGLAIDFKKSCMFSKQIKSGTFTETTPFHEKLYDKCQSLCDANKMDIVGEDDNDGGDIEEEEVVVVDNDEIECDAGNENSPGTDWRMNLKRVQDDIMAKMETLSIPDFKNFSLSSLESIKLRSSEIVVVVIIVVVMLFWSIFNSYNLKQEAYIHQIELLSEQVVILNDELKAIREILGQMAKNNKIER